MKSGNKLLEGTPDELLNEFKNKVWIGLSGIDFMASDELENNYKGQEAIDLRKEQIAQINGTLTNERIM